jgi:acetyltransferase
MGVKSVIQAISGLFKADSVVLVGASANPRALGFQIARSLMRNYKGDVYYVSATEARVLGKQTYATITDVPESEALWIIAGVTKAIPEILRRIGKLKPIAILLLIELPEYLFSQAKKVIANLPCPVIGPRSAGYFDATTNFDLLTIPAEMLSRPTQGATGVITDNRDVAFGLLEQISKYRCGVSRFVDLGETFGTNESEVLDFLVSDSFTRVILFGCGQIASKTRFKKAVTRAKQARKPIIVSLVPQEITEELKLHRRRDSNVIPLTTELASEHNLMITPSWGRAVDLALLCQNQPLPNGLGVAAISNFGAYCVYVADALHGSKLKLAAFRSSTKKALKENLPPYCRSTNPVCLYTNADEIRLDTALQFILPDPTVHSLIISLLPNSPYIDPDYLSVMLRQRLQVTPTEKTIISVVPAVERDNLLIRSLEQLNIPVYSNTHRAVTTLQNAYQLSAKLNSEK